MEQRRRLVFIPQILILVRIPLPGGWVTTTINPELEDTMKPEIACVSFPFYETA
jgi:hypothetical protein